MKLIRSLKPLLMLPLVFVAACSPEESSEIKHDFGSVNTDKEPITCKENPQPNNEPVFPELAAYIKKHVALIFESSRELIDPQYTVDSICISATHSEVPNAFASPNGEVMFKSAILDIFENDAQFAGTLAHELGHLLNRHGMLSLHPQLRNNETYMQLAKERDQKSDLISQGPQFSQADMNAMSTKFETLIEGLSDEDRQRVDAYLGTVGQMVTFAVQTNKVPTALSLLKSLATATDSGDWESGKQPYSLEDWVELMKYAKADVLANTAVDETLFLDFDQANNQMQISSLEPALPFFEITEQMAEIVAQETSAGEAANWQEQMADEVGMELMARAGWDVEAAPQGFINLQKTLNAQETLDQIANLGYETDPDSFNVKALADEVKGCPRLEGTHPAGCWRVANMYKELEFHKDELSEFRTSAAKNQFDNDLTELKKLAKDYASQAGASGRPSAGGPGAGGPGAGGHDGHDHGPDGRLSTVNHNSSDWASSDECESEGDRVSSDSDCEPIIVDYGRL